MKVKDIMGQCFYYYELSFLIHLQYSCVFLDCERSYHSSDHIHLLVCVQVSGVCTVCGARCRWRDTCWRWHVTAAAFAPEPP